MAEKMTCILQQQTKPIKIVKWKVKERTWATIGRVILLYEFDGENKSEQFKLKLSRAGTIRKIVAQEGAIIATGEVLCELEPCIHPTIMNDMCAECGADLRKDDSVTVASVPMVHAIPALKVSEELAQKLGKADCDRLLKDRKLALLVDLDQTLIHTTNDNIPPNIKDVYHFQLYGPSSPWYHTRLRPGTHQFLNNIYPYFELHICTFGARNYAHMIAAFLDPDQKFFSNRILSRDECFDPTSKKANLNALFPCGDHMVCIIDDREDVWSHASNLIHVKPYHFFQHTGDINAPPGLDKHEDDNKLGVDLSKIKKNNCVKNTIEKNNSNLEDKTIEETEDSVREKIEKIKNENEDEKMDETKNGNEDVKIKKRSDENGNSKIEERKKENEDVNMKKTRKENEDPKIEEVRKENDVNLGERMNENENQSIEESRKPSEDQDIEKRKADKVEKMEERINENEDIKIEEVDVKKEDNEKVEEIKLNGKVTTIDKDDNKIPDSAEGKDKKILDDENKQAEEQKQIKENTVANNEKKEEKPPDLIEIEDPDDYLIYLEDILKRIHQSFYAEYAVMENNEVPDLKKVIPSVRGQVLKGCKLVFSGLVPTHIKLEHSKAYQIARSLGAEVSQDLREDSTHLVAVRPGTAKVNAGRRKRSLKIVTPDWLWCCAERWELADEKIFPLSSRGSKNRHPPPHCSSPEHNVTYPEHNTPTTRKRTPSGRFMDTINPLMSFSSDDIADMDKEVEDILDDESDTTEDEETPPPGLLDLSLLNSKADEEELSSSSSEESLGGERRGHKRKRKDEENGDACTSTEDEVPSVKFRRGESVDDELDVEKTSSEDSEKSLDAPDEVDDGEWNMMGAALEREFLSNN